MTSNKIIDINYFQKKINDCDLKQLFTVNLEATLGEALEVMGKNKVGVIAILKEGKEVKIENIEGIITERDFLNKSPIQEKNWEDFKVETLMTRNPSYLDGSLPLADAIKLMVFRRFRQLFIKASNDEIKVLAVREVLDDIAALFKEDLDEIGVLKHPTLGADGRISDIIKEELIENPAIAGKMVLHARVFSNPIKKLFNQSALIIDEQESTLSVLDKLRKDKLGAAVIVNHGTLITGIVTERDFLFKVYGKMDDLGNIPIKKIMTKNPHFILDRNKLGYAVNNMLTFNYRNILVVDEEKYPLSIVALLDILDYLCRRVFDHLEKN